jgi:hypothetical protein
MTPKQLKAIRLIIGTYFKDSRGNPYKPTPGQCEIFAAVVNQNIKWVWLSAPTRYGKSEILAMACIYLAVFHQLKVPVVAGSEKKAEKIMEYVLQHISDHPELSTGLINAKSFTDVEKLKIKASKQALRWAQGGWVYVTSINAKQKSTEGEDVVGEGGDVVVLEEAGLIREKAQFSKVVRMPEGDWGKLVMSGNCIEKSIFEMAYKDPIYKKVRISLDQAIKEGRVNPERLEQQKKQTTSKDWKRYYLVEFPQAGEFSYFKPKKYDYLPSELEYYGALDPALGESSKGSLIGIVVLGKDATGQVYEIESHGLTDGPEEAMKFVLNLPYTFQRFGVEGVMFQRYYKNQMEAKSKELGKYIPFVSIEQKQNKLVRIESTEPIVNTGQVLVKEGSTLWNHMQDYPDLEKLDVLDTFEMCCRLMGLVGYDPKHDTSRLSF